MNFVIFLLNFDEILSEFREELQKIAVILDIFTELPEKFGKMLDISGFCEEFIRQFHCFYKLLLFLLIH